MACNKCNSKKKCGCSDSPLETIQTFQCPPNVNCPQPQTCSEFIDARCVMFTSGILEVLEGLDIPAGTTLGSAFQMMAIYIEDPTCLTGPCFATFDVYPTFVTITTITIAWAPSSSALTYQVEYKEEDSVTWLTLTAQSSTAPTQAVLSGLTTGTTYTIRVNSLCDGDNCYSAIITVTTK